MSYLNSQSEQGIGAILAIGPVVGTATPAYVPVFEVTDMPFKAQSWDSLDVTNFNSPGNVKEYRKGMIDGGKVTLKGNMVASDPGQVAMATAFADRLNAYLFKVTLPLAPGQTTTGTVFTFSALVMTWGPLSTFSPTKTIEFESELQITGPVVEVAGS